MKSLKPRIFPSVYTYFSVREMHFGAKYAHTVAPTEINSFSHTVRMCLANNAVYHTPNSASAAVMPIFAHRLTPAFFL